MSGARMLRGRVVTADTLVDDAIIGIYDGTVVYVEPTARLQEAQPDMTPPQHSGTILPGLVDMHCHGGGGHTLTTTDVAEVAAVVAHHRAAGTTTLTASLVTAAPEALIAQVQALAPLVHSGDLAGLHLEGPFLSHARCGAQAPEFLLEPDVRLVDRLLEAADGAIAMMTVAPELPGADKVCAELRSAGVVAALGHSDASYDVFAHGLRALGGHGVVTHLANGMPPLHHRAAGPVGATLVAAASGQATVELIADGVHVDSGFASLVFATAATGKVALVTDAMAAAGMPDGDYALGPARVAVRAGVARLAASEHESAEPAPAGCGSSIAGGTAHLLEIVARVVNDAEVPLQDAVRAATTTPAEILGIADSAGDIAAGRRADLLLVEDDLSLRRVMWCGEWLP